MAVLIGLGSIIGGYIGEQILNMVINALNKQYHFSNPKYLTINNNSLSIHLYAKKDK